MSRRRRVEQRGDITGNTQFSVHSLSALLMGGCTSRPNRIAAADKMASTAPAADCGADAASAGSEDWLEAAATKMAGMLHQNSAISSFVSAECPQAELGTLAREGSQFCAHAYCRTSCCFLSLQRRRSSTVSAKSSILITASCSSSQ